MKMLGTVLIIMSFSLFGWLRSQNSRELYNRALFLADLLTELAEYIKRSDIPIIAAIDRLLISEKFGRFKFLSHAMQKLNDKIPLGQALSDSFKMHENNRLLLNDDVDNISTALCEISGLNRQSEYDALNSASIRLRSSIASRGNEILNRQKLEMVLFPLCGCAVSVILL